MLSTTSLVRLQNTLQKVPTEFLPILKAKYAAKMFGEMSLQELNIATTKMIADIAVITGWNIPTCID